MICLQLSLGPLPAGQPSSAYKILVEGEREHSDFMLGILSHFWQTNTVQINIVISFDHMNPLNMPILKKQIVRIVYVL